MRVEKARAREAVLLGLETVLRLFPLRFTTRFHSDAVAKVAIPRNKVERWLSGAEGGQGKGWEEVLNRYIISVSQDKISSRDLLHHNGSIFNYCTFKKWLR